MVLAVSIRFDVVDAKGKPSFTKVRVPNGFALADYAEFGVAMAQLIATATTGEITRSSFCIDIDLSGATIKALASGLSDVAQRASFGFGTVLAGFRTKLRLPAFSEVKILPASDLVDQADGDVASFVAAMEGGIAVTAGTVAPSDMRENDIDALSYAREQFRKT